MLAGTPPSHPPLKKVCRPMSITMSRLLSWQVRAMTSAGGSRTRRACGVRSRTARTTSTSRRATRRPQTEGASPHRVSTVQSSAPPQPRTASPACTPLQVRASAARCRSRRVPVQRRQFGSSDRIARLATSGATRVTGRNA